jgi:hypothetical protein
MPAPMANPAPAAVVDDVRVDTSSRPQPPAEPRPTTDFEPQGPGGKPPPDAPAL